MLSKADDSMDEVKFRKRGWSEAEIARARSAKEKLHPEAAYGQHVRLWSLLIIAFGIATGMSVAIFPILAIMPQWFGFALFALIGGCLGLLISAALHTLDMHHKHHHHAMSVFVVICIMMMTLIISLMEERYGGIVNPLLAAITFAIGMIIPYQANRRIHGSS